MTKFKSIGTLTGFLTALFFLFGTAQSNAQSCANGDGTTTNGVTVTSSGTGSVTSYPASYTSCSTTIPGNSKLVGQNGAFTYTYTFSQPVNNAVIILAATGTGGNETFNCTTNGGTPSIVATQQCYSTINGNQILSGYGAPGTSTGGGGMFRITASSPYTELTITGPGGLSGSLMTICASSICPSPLKPTVSTTPATCSGPSTHTVSNYNSSYTYTFTPAGPSVNSSGTITGYAAGTSYTVTAATSCASATSAAFTPEAQLAAPPTPTVSFTAADCSAPSKHTVTNYSSSYTYSFYPGGSMNSSGVIGGLVPGTTYWVNATNTSGCTSSTSFVAQAEQAQLPTPPTPTVSFTAADCSAPSKHTVTNYSSSYTYSFYPGGSMNSSGVIGGLVPGTTYWVNATNTSGCTSYTSFVAQAEQAQLPTPATPSVTATDPTCTTPTGAVNVTAPVSGITYTLTPGNISNTSGSFTGLPAASGPYTVKASNTNCASQASNTVSIAAQPNCCDANAGTITSN